MPTNNEPIFIMESQRLEYLFTQYLEDNLSEKESIEWSKALNDESAHQKLNELVENTFDRKDILKYKLNDSEAERIRTYIISQPQAKKSKIYILYKRIASVAAVLAFIFVGIYLIKNENTKEKKLVSQQVNTIHPGKIGATLTLANGTKISLTDSKNGKIAKESGISITKLSNGVVVYKVESNNADPISTNVLSTAKGETYAVELPDHSKIWLNAASSLTYSSALLQNGIRAVKLEGEAYFEIAKDAAHPFVVESKGQKVEVLGTHFNIDSYNDDPNVVTTLLEGSVRLKFEGQQTDRKSVILKPGQKAVLTGNTVKIKIADIDEAIAWKNGQFVFNNESLESIMRKISRWYNVEVAFQTEDLKEELFWGSTSRFDNVSDVLHMLETTGSARFDVKNKKLLVRSK